MRALEALSIETGQTSAALSLVDRAPDGGVLLVSTWGLGPEIHRWDMRNGESVWHRVEELPEYNDVVLASLSDGRCILAVSTEDGVERWNALTGEPLNGIEPEGYTVWGLAAGHLPDGRTVLVGAGNNHTVHRWDAATGDPLGPPLRGHHTTVLSVGLVHLSASSVVIVSGDDSGFLRRWDAVTGDPIGDPVAGHAAQVNIIAPLASNGGRKLFASSDAKGEICWWDATTGEQLGGPFTTGAEVYALATACPGGTPLLLAAGANQQTGAWNVITGEQVGLSLRGVSVAALDQPDGTTLVATGTQGEVIVYSLSE